MTLGDDLRLGRHCVFRLHVHLVFVAKYRRRVFDARALDALKAIFAKAALSFDAQLVEMDGEDDRILRRDRPDLRRRYYRGVLWSPSYFATSCGGAPIAIIRRYIEQQKRPA